MKVTLFAQRPVLVLTPDTTEEVDALDKLRISCNLMDIEAAQWSHPPSKAGRSLTVALTNIDALHRANVGEHPASWFKKG